MADPRTLFRRRVASIAGEGRRASADLVRRLKRMSAAEFLNQPWTVTDQLTWAQYKDVVSVIAPDVKLTAAKIEKPEEEKRSLLDWWRARSSGFRSFVWTAAVTAILVLLSTAVPWLHKVILSREPVVRSTSEQWPPCKRLSAYTDGCIYTPTQDLDWNGVARELDISVETLRRANPHLPTPFIIRRAPLYIWRGRGRLEN